MIIKKLVTIYGRGYNKKRVKALFDTGAESSFIKFDLAKKLNLIGKRKVSVYSAGYYEEVGKEVYTAIVVDRRKFPVRLIIIKKVKGDSLILGVDFLQNAHIKIDYKKHIITTTKDKYKYRGIRM